MTDYGNLIIHSLIFDVTLPEYEGALAIQNRLSTLSEQVVPDILERAIAPYDQADMIIQIERLELDLGSVQLDSLEDELRKKLLAKLAEYLAENLGCSLQQPRFAIQIPQLISYIEQLQQFLVTGSLPWNSNREAFRSIDEMVFAIMEAEPTAFGKVLQRIIPIHDVRQRLIFNLRIETLRRLLTEYLGITASDFDSLQRAIAWISDQLTRFALEHYKKRFCFEAFLLQLCESQTIEPEILFQQWVHKELHPTLFSSGKQWSAFRESVVAELPNALVSGRSHFLDTILVGHLDAIAKQFPPLPDTPDTASSNFKPNRSDLTAAEGEIPTFGTNSIEQRGVIANPQTFLQKPTEAYWFIYNSGLILLYPYLKRYLDTLNLLKGNHFISRTHQLQAVHALEILVRGHNSYREYDLILNKMLCGLPLSIPIDPEYEIEAWVETEAEQLLQSAIRNWAIIKNTSVDGFRRSFLMRDGKLIQREMGWTLICDRKGYDVLLEHLPYPIYVVKLAWMEQPLYVEW